jgi:hypothetical protein
MPPPCRADHAARHVAGMPAAVRTCHLGPPSRAKQASWQDRGLVLDMCPRACRPNLSARLCALLENMVDQDRIPSRAPAGHLKGRTGTHHVARARNPVQDCRRRCRRLNRYACTDGVKPRSARVTAGPLSVRTFGPGAAQSASGGRNQASSLSPACRVIRTAVATGGVHVRRARIPPTGESSWNERRKRSS